MSESADSRRDDFIFPPDPWWKKWVLWSRGISEHLLEPQDVRAIFLSSASGGVFENVQKLPSLKLCADQFLGREHGIFLTDGKEWKKSRKAFSRMFSGRAIREVAFPIFCRKAAVLADILQESTPENRAEVDSLFHQLTLDAVLAFAFGRDERSLERRRDPEWMQFFQQLHKKAFSRCRGLAWALGLPCRAGDGSELLERRLYDSGFLPWLSSPESRDSPVGKALSEYPPGQRENIGFDFWRNFMLAGRDTTAVTLTWLIIELFHSGADRGLLRRLRKEALEVEPEDLLGIRDGLPLTHACIFETLRLHAPIPRETRVYVGKDVTALPSGTVLRPGDLLSYHPWEAGRSESWERPLEFDPDRWTQDGKSKIPDQYVLPVFNAGRRLCLGRGFALLEIATVLHTLLRRGVGLELELPRREYRHATDGFVAPCAVRVNVSHSPLA